MPALLVTEESLEAMNERLHDSPLCSPGCDSKLRLRGQLPVDWRRFRPNIAVRQDQGRNREQGATGTAALPPGVSVGPFAEDSWWRVRFVPAKGDGDGQGREGMEGEGPHFVDATGTKLCVRCNIPQIDPDTGTSGGYDAEPAATLRKFRSSAKGVLVGINMSLHVPVQEDEQRNAGSTFPGLMVGDVVQVLQGALKPLEPPLIPEHEQARS